MLIEIPKKFCIGKNRTTFINTKHVIGIDIVENIDGKSYRCQIIARRLSIFTNDMTTEEKNEFLEWINKNLIGGNNDIQKH
jgi:hypothetical protein